MNMFCYQCEQTAGGKACTVSGVCGKDPQTAALQDLLLYSLKDISRYAHRARQMGSIDQQVNVFTVKALFSTLTNVNFDPERFVAFIQEAAGIRDKAIGMYEQACGKTARPPEKLDCPVEWWRHAQDIDKLNQDAMSVDIGDRIEVLGEDIAGLQELVTYGLKGLAAYADHAQILGVSDDEVYEFIHRALDCLTAGPSDANGLVALAMECGKVNLRAMEILDQANTASYGHPEPTSVRITPVKGKCILISGHDLKDLADLLEQTEGCGINIYTHGEMLPANAYPGMKKYKHLVGNYGGAWQDQQSEFDAFPGAILMTTNCLQRPKASYADRIFTAGVVGFPGMRHISDGNFGPVTEAALAQNGFESDEPEKRITIGFARNAVLSVAGKVVELVKAGKIRHFFLVGGCDGAKSGRNYYTQFAQTVPEDCVILTLACGKYRFNKLDFGQIDGIPRLLDCGQCNDAYSAVAIASALAKAFGCTINDLPLSMILSWYEQKAVAILLTLLYLGIKDMKLGPTLPAFVSPNVLKVLVEKFNIAPVGNARQDLAAALK